STSPNATWATGGATSRFRPGSRRPTTRRPRRNRRGRTRPGSTRIAARFDRATMITGLLLIVVAGFAVALLRRSAHPESRRPPSVGERIYMILAPVPVLLALVAPGILVLMVGISARAWSGRVSNAGILLSLGLTVVGIISLWRRRRHAGGSSPWFEAAVF